MLSAEPVVSVVPWVVVSVEPLDEVDETEWLELPPLAVVVVVDVPFDQPLEVPSERLPPSEEEVPLLMESDTDPPTWKDSPVDVPLLEPVPSVCAPPTLPLTTPGMPAETLPLTESDALLEADWLADELLPDDQLAPPEWLLPLLSPSDQLEPSLCDSPPEVPCDSPVDVLFDQLEEPPSLTEVELEELSEWELELLSLWLWLSVWLQVSECDWLVVSDWLAL
jgi:hypothetical protein